MVFEIYLKYNKMFGIFLVFYVFLEFLVLCDFFQKFFRVDR